MNMYDEILNKYAQFLGYEGKVKADERSETWLKLGRYLST